MGHVDSLNTEMNKYSRYVVAKQKQDSAKDAFLQKRVRQCCGDLEVTITLSFTFTDSNLTTRTEKLEVNCPYSKTI